MSETLAPTGGAGEAARAAERGDVMGKYPYEVQAMEQCGATVWSRHATQSAAERAMRAYRRKSDQAHDAVGMVDHGGFRVVRDGRVVEAV